MNVRLRKKFLSAKLIDLDSPDAKINPDMLRKEIEVLGIVHHAQPGAISITQSTEYGTLYSVDELKEIVNICKNQDYVFIWTGRGLQMLPPPLEFP